MLPAGDISVGEALENSKQRNSHESSGQLLDGSRIFYHLFHCIVRPYTRVWNTHGGVRSAAVAEASIF